MRNALNKLADTVTDPSEKKVSNTPHHTIRRATLCVMSMGLG